MAKDWVTTKEVSRTTTRDRGGKGVTVVRFQQSLGHGALLPVPSQGNLGNTRGSRKGVDVELSGGEARRHSRYSKMVKDRSANRSHRQECRRRMRQERERSKKDDDNDGDEE